jgi:D-arabinose 1-dehydrogenase-like Zn-dependent alcohol dehydrogenase
MLDFASRYEVTPLIETMPMNQANTAIEMVRQNMPRYRIVLINN